MSSLWLNYTEWQKKCASPKSSLTSAWRKFSSVQVSKAGPINQPMASWEAIIKREGLQTRSAAAFLFRDIAYSEIMKGVAVGFKKAWSNARSVTRELNVHHQTMQRWWSRWNEEGPGRRTNRGTNPGTRPLTNRARVGSPRLTRARSLPSTSFISQRFAATTLRAVKSSSKSVANRWALRLNATASCCVSGHTRFWYKTFQKLPYHVVIFFFLCV